jgi:hypothetical protein
MPVDGRHLLTTSSDARDLFQRRNGHVCA